MRTALGIALLAFQLGMIAYARFSPSRYFCWAPFHAQSNYEMGVTVNGRALTAGEIERRYRRPQKGINSRTIQDEKGIIMQYEQTYGKSERTEVTLRYRVNGGAEQVWQWPPPPR
jgi:hypothetical protein